MPAESRKQQQMMAIALHNPSKLYKENKGVLKMSNNQLHDFAGTKGLGEHTPVHMLKREGVSLESSKADRAAGKEKKFEEADYISQSKSNPHAAPAPKKDRWYKEHGEGIRFEEEEDYNEDHIQKGVSPKNGPRTNDISSEICYEEEERVEEEEY